MSLNKINYQINKTLGFRLKDKWGFVKNEKINKLSENLNSYNNYLNKILNLLIKIFKDSDSSNFKKVFFINLENNKLYNFDISKNFWYKRNFFSGKTRYANIKISKIGFKNFKDYILKLERKFLNYIEILNNFIANYDKGLLIKESKIRNFLRNLNIDCNELKELLESISLDLLDNKLKDNIIVLKNFSNQILDLLMYENNPFENSNRLFRFSFNYYTLNKKPYNFSLRNENAIVNLENFNYTQVDIEEHYKILKEQIEKELDKNIDQLNIRYDFNLLRLLEKEFNLKAKELSLKDLKIKLKEIKMKIKKEINDILNKEDFEKLRKENSFFYFDKNKNIEKFQKLIKKINHLKSDIIFDKNKTLKEELEKCKKRKEKYFTQRLKAFPNYIQLTNLYQTIAAREGKIKTQLNGLEKEKQEFLSLKYWAFILEDNSKHKHLLLIDKYQRSQFKNFLVKFSNKKESKYKLYEFKSLTLQSLEKLIFNSYNEDFFNNLKKEEKITHFLREFEIKNKNELKNKIKNEKNLIEFYKLALRSNHANRVLDLKDFELDIILNKNYNTLLDFEIDFNKKCFCLKEYYIDEEILNYIKNNFNSFFFEIYSLSNKNFHFQIWLDFWNNPYGNIRLNPEGSIFFKVYSEGERKEIEKYKEELEKLGKKFIRNRVLENNFIVYFNFSLNYPAKQIKKSFKEEKILLESIKEFNKDFLRLNNLKNLNFLTIDLGQLELATAAIISFKEEGNTFDLQKMKVYKLKKEFLTKEYVKNLTNFFDNFDKFFEELEVDHLNLTTAKLMRDKIILNGDILTYLKLKEVAAKRKLFNLITSKNYIANSKIKFSIDYIPNLGENIFYIEQQSESQPLLRIYSYDPDFEKIKSKDEIATELNSYLNHLLLNQAQQEEINNLRRAVVSNIVGVISYLQDKFDTVIVLENLSKETREKHFEQENFVIDSELDWGIYKKAQTKFLAPPNINNFKLLKELEKGAYFHLGSLIFVPEKDTSKICPFCNSYYQYEIEKNSFKNMKFIKRELVCHTCKKTIHPDLVTCINLAKKAFGFLKDSINRD